MQCVRLVQALLHVPRTKLLRANRVVATSIRIRQLAWRQGHVGAVRAAGCWPRGLGSEQQGMLFGVF